jgi:cytochrome c556
MKTSIALTVVTLSLAAAGFGVVGSAGLAIADKVDLPPGPIRDRHELMEGIGDNAKKIGDSLKAGKIDDVAVAAKQIQADAGKALPLFPKGSTDPKSRAKDEIWTDWAKFEKLMKDLEVRAGELATVAENKGDVSGASKAMFGNCKSCHDDFRKPDEKEKKS